MTSIPPCPVCGKMPPFLYSDKGSKQEVAMCGCHTESHCWDEGDQVTVDFWNELVREVFYDGAKTRGIHTLAQLDAALAAKEGKE